ncbi:MAG: hypothetical protein IPP44_20785 [Ideonella sp.]|nr:hypothetical protein [Ideonella sp.]
MTRHPDNATPFAAILEDGWLCGPWRRPTNNSSHEAGTIHDDATAKGLGFRSGTVAGSIHMEQFLPLLLHAFGPEWQCKGSLSLWFREPSADGEAVRAMVQAASTGRREVRMVRADGAEVLSGSASAGPDQNGALRQRLAAMRPGDPPRMLAPLLVGFQASGLPTRVPQADVERRLPIITECLPAFALPAGEALAPLSAAVHALRVFEERLPIARTGFVGLFGGIEWQWLNGPMVVGRAYEVSGRVLAVTDSPRSEMLWTETTLHDPANGLAIARMLMLSRLLKESSPLWNQGAAQP